MISNVKVVPIDTFKIGGERVNKSRDLFCDET